MLGIVIGVMAAIVIASILTGMRQSIISIIEEYGTNNIYAFHLSTGPRTATIVPSVFGNLSSSPTPKRSKHRQQRLRTSRWPRRMLDTMVVRSTITSLIRVKIIVGETPQGVTANYAGIANINLSEGRFITDSDDRRDRT